MEENNNVLIKSLAFVLILILALNVYRTETTKKEMSRLAKDLEVVMARIDTLACGVAPETQTKVAVPAAPAVTKKQFSDLSKTVTALETKINTLNSTVDKLARAQQSSGNTSVKSPSSSANTQPIRSESVSSSKASSQNVRVSVSAKVKAENRYVSGTTYTPKVSVGPVGSVIVDIVLNRVGMVTSVSINSGTTINDEDSLEACKEAALKTSFGYNPDAPDKAQGTITYTVTAR